MSRLSGDAIVGLVREAIAPKQFMGGPASDYRVIIGKGSTLLTEHIASGKKVPAVEVAASVLSKVRPPSIGNGGAVLAVTATITTVASVYSAFKAREAAKGANALAAEVTQARTPPVPDAQSQPEGGPHPGTEGTRAEVGHSEALDLVAAVEIQDLIKGQSPERVLAPVRGERASPGREPRRRVEPLRTSETSEHVHTPTLNVVVELPVTETRGEPTEATVDWPHTVESQVATASQEVTRGDSEDARERLTQLLFYLDNLLGEERSPLYPAITVEPLVALAEVALHEREAGGATAEDAAADCAEHLARLQTYATATEDAALSHRVHLLARRLNSRRDR